MRELDKWIEKVEKIISVGKVSSDEISDILEFLGTIDEENRHILSLLHKNNANYDTLKEVLCYYNVITSELPLSERKSKLFMRKGNLTKNAFDVYKYKIPEGVLKTLDNIKKIENK